MMVIQKKLTNKIIIKYRINLINHFYIMLLKIYKLDSRLKKPRKKMKIVNIYDNSIKKRYI